MKAVKYIFVYFLLYSLFSTAMALDNSCDANQCDYSVPLNKTGFYVIAVQLPECEKEGMWGFSVLTSSGKNSGGFNAGTVLEGKGALPGFLAFYLSSPEVVQVEVIEYPSSPRQLKFSLSDNNRKLIQEKWMNSNEKISTQLLNPGFYIASVETHSDSPRTRFGISVTGNNFSDGVNVGGLIDSKTGGNGEGFGGLYVGAAQTVSFKLLYGNKYDSAGSGRPNLTFNYQNPNGNRELYWTAPHNKTCPPSTTPITPPPILNNSPPHFAGIQNVTLQPPSSAHLTWNPATSVSTPNNIEYQVHLSQTSNFIPSRSTLVEQLSHGSTDYTLRNLQVETNYNALVVAIDGNGLVSAGYNYKTIYLPKPTTPIPSEPITGTPESACTKPQFAKQANLTPNTEILSNTVSYCGVDTLVNLTGVLASMVINGQDVGSRATLRSGDTLAIKTTSPTAGMSSNLTVALGQQNIVWSLSSAAIAQPAAVSGTMAGSTSIECGVSEAGQAQCTLPISAPLGSSGMTPKLSLIYGQGGNGLVGLGWTMGGLSAISRCAATLDQERSMTGTSFSAAVDFSDNDRFCLDGERLMADPNLYGKDGAEYRTEQESFQKVVSYGQVGNAPEKFLIKTKDGLTMEYGYTLDSRIEAQGRADVLVWALNKLTDSVGNYYTLSYQENNANGEYYPLQIDYTGNVAAGLVPYASVRFEYEARPDIVPTYVAGSLLKTTQRLRKIETRVGNDIYRAYRLSYEQSSSTQQSRLVQVQECGTDGKCFEPTVFGWGAEESGFINKNNFISNAYGKWDRAASRIHSMDVNGDGLTDIVIGPNDDGEWFVLKNTGNNFVDEGAWISGAYGDWDGAANRIRPMDVNGDGLADIVIGPNGDGEWFVLKNTGSSFVNEGAWISGAYSNWDGAADRIRPMDVNGDGLVDIVVGPGPTGKWYVLKNTGNSFVDEGAWISEAYGSYYAAANRIRPMDVNGDGLADIVVGPGPTGKWHVLKNTGNSFVDEGTWISGAYGNYYAAANRIRPMDVNGDGLADIVVGPGASGRWYVLKNTGNSFVDEGAWISGAYGNWDGAANRIRPMDVNGDGLADIVIGPNGAGEWFVLKNTGSSFVDEGAWISGAYGSWDGAADRIHPMDVNGDGVTDIVIGPNGAGEWFVLETKHQPISLKTITTGNNQKTTFTYKPLTDSSVYKKGSGAVYPEMDFMGAFYVVSSISSDNGIGGQRALDYFYEGAKVHLQGRGFRGFSKTTITDRETGLQNITFYDRDYRYLSTKVKRTETRLSDGRLLSETDNQSELIVQGYGVHFSRIKKSISREYELDGGLTQSTVTENFYDNYGNPTQIKISHYQGAETGTPQYTEATDNIYENDVVNWYLGRLKRTQVTKNAAGQGVVTRASAWEYSPTTGLLTKEVIEPEHALCLEKSYQYDALGNITQSHTKPCNEQSVRTQRTEYDTQGRFALRSINALNQSETRQYDGFGNLLALTGPNQLTTRWTYDGFGRTLLELRADGTWTQQAYLKHDESSPCSSHSSYYVQSQAAGGNVSYQCFDKLDREIRQATFGFNGQLIFVDTEYNARSEVARKSIPYFSTDTPQWTVYEYDTISRPVKEIAPDGSINTVAYQGLTTVTTNSLGQKNTEIRDVRGNVVQTIDHLGNSVNTLFDGNGNAIQVSATRNGAELMSPTVIEYDKLGYKIRMSEPNTGITRYEYNALGELIRQTDANGQTVSNEYDTLGRLVKRSTPEGVTTWTYDTTARGIGKLAEVVGTDGYKETIRYDVFGRASETITTIGNQKFVTTTQFDQYSRAAGMVYPTGFAVHHVYNQYGYLSEVREATTNRIYWKAEISNARGQLEKATLGNGLETRKTYNNLTGLIKTIYTGTPASANSVQNLGFEFDALGNLTERRKGNLFETFNYDGLNRLVKSTLSNGQTISLTYDSLGNITSKSDVGAYLYGSGRPHAVTQAGGVNYEYDAVGNRISASNGEQIKYTSFNKPSEIVKGTSRLTFQYAPDYSRYRQTVLENGQTKEILYLGLYEQETSNGITQGKHTIVAGGQSIAVHLTSTQNAPKLRYLHQDHLGSVDVMTDEMGQVVESLSFDAWGRHRNAVDWRALSETEISELIKSLEWRRGFTDHEHLNAVELIHMNGRIYDPIIGRFLSADPFVQSPHNLQNLNRYSYVLNNPLSYTDPSGYLFKALKKLGKAIEKNWKAIVSIGVGIVVGVLTAGIGTAIGLGALGGAILSGAGFGFASSFTGSMLSGRSFGDSLVAGLKGGVVGGITAGLTFGVGHVFFEGVSNSLLQFGLKTVAHGMVQGVSTMAQGGRFEHGFLAGMMGKVGGHFGLVGSVVAAGTAAEISGGKFVNGAVSGAFVYLFNDAISGKNDKGAKYAYFARKPLDGWLGKAPEYLQKNFILDHFNIELSHEHIVFTNELIENEGIIVDDLGYGPTGRFSYGGNVPDNLVIYSQAYPADKIFTALKMGQNSPLKDGLYGGVVNNCQGFCQRVRINFWGEFLGREPRYK